MLKYKIKHHLDKLTLFEYRMIVKIVPRYLGRTINTFWNYVNIKADSPMDIPHCTVRKLEIFFSLKPGELLSTPVKGKPYAQVINEFKKSYKNSSKRLFNLEDSDDFVS